MPSDEMIESFAKLFVGRLDAYGTEEGGCERAVQWTWPNYLARVEAHLRGDAPMGVYPMVNDSEKGWVVKWGCVDFDEGDEPSWVHACNLHMVLHELGVTAWVERSRSKGFHVWVFADQWVPAAVMRRALLGATQVAGAPTKEINPKAEELAENKLGNYVRLPYNGMGQFDGRRCIVRLTDREAVRVDSFVSQALEHRATLEDIERLVPLWTPPAKPKRLVVPPLADGRPALERLDGLTYTIWKDGPLDGSDRSGTLWKLTNKLFECGLTYEEAQGLLYAADEAWGKFIARGDEARLDQMLDKVWEE